MPDDDPFSPGHGDKRRTDALGQYLVDLVRLGWKGLFGNAAKDKAVDLLRTSKCRIATEPKVPIQIDGDEVEQTAPFEFEVLPERLLIKTLNRV